MGLLPVCFSCLRFSWLRVGEWFGADYFDVVFAGALFGVMLGGWLLI